MKYKSVIATTLLALLGVAACAQTTDAGFSVVVRHFVAPAYPVAAWLARVQGTVVTEVIIKPDGQRIPSNLFLHIRSSANQSRPH
jgi:hypothetical protein